MSAKVLSKLQGHSFTGTLPGTAQKGKSVCLPVTALLVVKTDIPLSDPSRAPPHQGTSPVSSSAAAQARTLLVS